MSPLKEGHKVITPSPQFYYFLGQGWVCPEEKKIPVAGGTRSWDLWHFNHLATEQVTWVDDILESPAAQGRRFDQC